MNVRNVDARITRRRLLAAGAGTAALAIGGAFSPPRRSLAQTGAVRYISSDGVRLRSGAGLRFSILDVLSSGEAVGVNESGPRADGYDWSHVTVQSSGRSGYVASQFLGRTIGGDPEDARFPIGSTFVVDTTGGGGANLRARPGTDALVVRSVSNGTRGEILSGPAYSGPYAWFNVAVAGTTGYLADAVIAPASGGSGGSVRVADGPLNLRAQPSTGGRIVLTATTDTQAAVNDVAPVRADGYTWINVTLYNDAGTTGWFAEPFLVYF